MINGRTIGIDARMIEMSGIGTYIQHLMGHGIYDYAIGAENEIRRYDRDVKIIPYNASIYGLNEQLRYPFGDIKRLGVELMHFPHYNVPIGYRGKFVVTIHDLTHIVLPEFLGGKIKYEYAKILMSHAVKKAMHIFTVSENSKEDIIRYFNPEASKISITYNAVDSDFVVKDRKDIEYLYSKYGIPKEKSLVLYVGNLKPHKNLKTLLQAMTKLDDDVVLLLVGKAFKSVSLEEEEDKLHLKSRVIHTGMVEKNELVDLYNIADVFAFPSLYEGFGIPPLESMSCGTPVVAANNSSIPEVVGDAAILFDGENADELADGIRQIIDHPQLAGALVDKGFRRCHNFRWNDTVSEVQETIGKITAAM